jgi:hypothetical protein
VQPSYADKIQTQQHKCENLEAVGVIDMWGSLEHWMEQIRGKTVSKNNGNETAKYNE